MSEKDSTSAASENTATQEAVTRAAQEATAVERKRTADLLRFGRDFGHMTGVTEAVARAIENPAATLDTVRAEALEAMRKAEGPTVARPQLPDAGPAHYGMGARELLHSGSLKAFRGVGARLGGTMSDEQVAYRAGQWVRAALFGDPQSARWCRDAGVELRQGSPDMLGFGVQQRDLIESSFTAAGYLVPVEMEAAIINNREQYGIARTICRVVPMTATSIQIPRITADMTAYFTGGEGNDGTASDPTGDQVTLTLKDLMAYTKIGKSTAQSTIVGLAEMVADEQARAFAVKEDACLTVADGTSTYGGIRGCVTLLELAAYAGGRATTASGHDTFPELDATDISAAVGLLPVYARAGSAWLCSGMFEATVFGRLRMSAGGNDNPGMASSILAAPYAGFPVGIAHAMPAGATTDYTTKVMALLGNFRLGVAIGSGVGMMLTVDPYTLAHQNLTRIISVERFDLVAHGVNASTTVPGPIVAIYGNS
jgi:HK97 family phage major capsid protein